MRRSDRIVGIVLGLLLGLAIVILFVFIGSQDTIDSPSIDEDSPPVERWGEPPGER